MEERKNKTQLKDEPKKSCKKSKDEKETEANSQKPTNQSKLKSEPQRSGSRKNEFQRPLKANYYATLVELENVTDPGVNSDHAITMHEFNDKGPMNSDELKEIFLKLNQIECQIQFIVVALQVIERNIRPKNNETRDKI